MTYSMREFVEIANPFESSARVTQMYKLYKFLDRRDPRYQSLMRVKQPIADHLDWCGSSYSTVKVVLFIPGHWGSYTQSRSLGAHGLRLTGKTNDVTVKSVVDSLRIGSLSGDALDEQSFIFEVLAVDFAGQGAALHGHFLRSQSEYVFASVKHISRVCNVNSVTLVGHSMGGIVARLVPVLYPESAYLVRDIITLASPHSNPIYAFDYSIQRVYEELATGWSEDTLVISVSTGLKDEMIEPGSSYIISNSSISILATDMLRNGEFGMDHQAITWCFDVLFSLRSVIWALSVASEETVFSRLKHAKKHLDLENSFESNYLSSKYNFSHRFGLLRGSSIESGMFYNYPNLLSLFCIVGWLRCSFSSTCDTYNLLLTVMCGWCFCDSSKGCTLILTLVANLVHSLLSSIMPVGFCMDKSFGASILIFLIPFTTIIIIFYQFSGVMVDTTGLNHTDAWIILFFIAWIFGCLFLIVGFSHALCRKRDSSFVSLAFIVTMVASIGSLSLILWGGRPEAWNWQSVLLILLSVCLYHWHQRRHMEDEHGPSSKSLYSLWFTMSVVVASKLLLARGRGYRLVLVMPAAAISNIIRTRLARQEPKREKNS